ncbi:hypothetical protein [Litchfieldia alkalitelluris]|uniref:hypothetical protein n=1 Tax=Litchfieldia alkalitelluris TaxID=304268 RepID=UPI0009984C3B|nr:hypothetical protein [Litchfieldia alkalitelluris]
MNEKIFYPNTKGILKMMAFVYLIVVVFGSVLNTYFHSTSQEWLLFFKVSLIYILVCSILFVLIKSQQIIISKKEFKLKLAGFTRYQITLSSIGEIRKGKMNGSPIMEIKSKNNRIFPVPFLPFEAAWEEVLEFVRQERGESIIGEMKLKRKKGELRTWE